jgi:hypothetical protein
MKRTSSSIDLQRGNYTINRHSDKKNLKKRFYLYKTILRPNVRIIFLLPFLSMLDEISVLSTVSDAKA